MVKTIYAYIYTYTCMHMYVYCIYVEYLRMYLHTYIRTYAERVIELMMNAYQTLTDLEFGKCAAKCLEDMCKYYLQMNRLEVGVFITT